MKLRTAALLLLMAHLPATGADGVAYDFERGDALAAYEGLAVERNTTAEVVAPGADGRGHALRIANPEPGRYATLRVRVPIRLEKNLVLSLDHRAEVEAGRNAGYVGILFFAGDKQYFASVPF